MYSSCFLLYSKCICAHLVFTSVPMYSIVFKKCTSIFKRGMLYVFLSKKNRPFYQQTKSIGSSRNTSTGFQVRLYHRIFVFIPSGLCRNLINFPTDISNRFCVSIAAASFISPPYHRQIVCACLCNAHSAYSRTFIFYPISLLLSSLVFYVNALPPMCSTTTLVFSSPAIIHCVYSHTSMT